MTDDLLSPDLAPPEDLDPPALRAWQNAIAQLAPAPPPGLGLELVADFARAYSRYRQAEKLRRDTGQIISRDGRLGPNPVSAIANDALREVRRLADDLGIYPFKKREFVPGRDCGATTSDGRPCGNGKGQETSHPGSGNCYLHGGATPNGEKHGESEAAEDALRSLAVPTEGDPIEVLQATVQAAHGVLVASQRLLAGKPTETHLRMYLTAIERASRVAKAAVESFSVDRMDKLNERIVDMLEHATERALGRLGISARRQTQFRGLLREELDVELARSRN